MTNSSPFAGKTIGIIGLGKIGGALLTGMRDSGQAEVSQFRATAAHPESRRRIVERHGVIVRESNAALALESDIIVLATKPHKIGTVLNEIAAAVDADKLIVSVAAGVTIQRIREHFAAPVKVVRAMPNMPAMIGEGMTGLASGPGVSEAEFELASAMFGSVGRVLPVDEDLLDAVTGLAGSGPAFVYIIIESLAEAGVKVGLPRETALLMAAQTVLGAARMVIETGEHPAKLKEDITTPAGTTIDGILELEEGKLRVTLIKAVVKATERASQFSRKHGA